VIIFARTHRQFPYLLIHIERHPEKFRSRRYWVSRNALCNLNHLSIVQRYFALRGIHIPKSKFDEFGIRFNFKQDDSMTYNEQGDEAWTVMIRNGVDDERSEFRYLYQYDSRGNWTEKTTINGHGPGDPNTQRRTLAY
jgi:hypothetical protein